MAAKLVPFRSAQPSVRAILIRSLWGTTGDRRCLMAYVDVLLHRHTAYGTLRIATYFTDNCTPFRTLGCSYVSDNHFSRCLHSSLRKWLLPGLRLAERSLSYPVSATFAASFLCKFQCSTATYNVLAGVTSLSSKYTGTDAIQQPSM